MKNRNILSNIIGDSLIKNSIYLMTTSFFSGILGFLFWIIAARYYTPNDVGITSAMFSSLTLVSIISFLGLTRALIFYLPRNGNTNKIINSCLTTGIISSAIFSLIFISGLKIWAPELLLTLNNLGNISIFIAVTIAMSISGLIGASFTAGRRSSFLMIKEAVYHFVKMFPLILFTSFGAIGIVMSIGVGFASAIIVGFILLPKVWKYSPGLILDPIIKDMASFSAGNYVAGLLYNLPKLIFPVIILNMIEAKSAGYFYIAMMTASILYDVSLAISSSLLVESSDQDQFFNNIMKSIKFNLIIASLGILSFIIFGKFILNIFNPSYAENAATTMIILAATSIPLSLVNIFTTVRNSQGRVASMIKMNMLTASITFILSIPLIRVMNIEGAAVSYLIANTVGALIVISRINSPKEFTLKLLNDIKNDVQYNF